MLPAIVPAGRQKKIIFIHVPEEIVSHLCLSTVSSANLFYVSNSAQKVTKKTVRTPFHCKSLLFAIERRSPESSE
jgi:hypothetical protein